MHIAMVTAYMYMYMKPRPPQADVTGLCWVRYTGPMSSTLEAPKDDPVLNSYAQLLNEG